MPQASARAEQDMRVDDGAAQNARARRAHDVMKDAYAICAQRSAKSMRSAEEARRVSGGARWCGGEAHSAHVAMRRVR